MADRVTGSIAQGCAPLFDGIAAWLMKQGITEASLADIAQGLGRLLVDAGIPLSRMSVGGLILHPAFGAMDVTWVAATDEVRTHTEPRSAATTPAFRQSPFYHASTTGTPFSRYHLEGGRLEREFPMFERLRQQDITDYVVFFHGYGRHNEVLWADLPPGMEGMIGSFATTRPGGFSDAELDYLRELSLPLGLAAKEAMTMLLARSLMHTYLGEASGDNVLDGLVERGSGRMIKCAIWYSDLRGSTALADRLPLDEYLATINDYFDCTAGAVLDHGGEVLKFIGDAVLAIFPIGRGAGTPVEMCDAAAASARASLERLAAKNDERRRAGLDPLRIGIALHAGELMYGNVGTERRLDFTIVGTAANEANRLESLCKTLQTPVVASARFADTYAGELQPLGRHAVAGLSYELEAYTLPDLPPTA